jgi:hypothetical protein
MSNIKGRFPTAMDMINQLIAAEATHALLKQLQHYATPDLLVCDEWAYLSLGQQGSHLFFQVISQRHQRQSTVIPTNWPFADWGKGVDSTPVATAIADRLVHNSEVLSLGGTSYRRKRTEPHPRRTTAVKGGVPGLALRPQRPFFVVGQATTRHPCAYMTSWPIFQPMVLADFVTGGNTRERRKDARYA